MPFSNTYTTFDDVECGLVSVHEGFALPLHLQKCVGTVEVVNHVGHYTLLQTYVNLTDDTLEALYIFPIQEGGAVHYFTAESNGKVVKSEVKEKGASDEDEDDLAMGDNRTGFLISEFKPDLYQLALGELGPNSVTNIELRYVCELPVERDAVKLSIPTTIAPQYTKPTADCAEKTAADQLVDLDKDLDIEVHIKVRQTVAFKAVSDPEDIAFVDGEAVDEDGFYYSTGTFAIQRTAFEEEQTIFVSTITGKPFGARILIEETSKGEVAAMVTLVPEFPYADHQSEMIFLVDRSGSMNGRSIEKAKEALQIFLASLPSDCKFNICSFNASFDFLFRGGSRNYDNDSLAEARAYVDAMQAGGGTKVYEPLETIFKQQIEDGCQRQIFVLTDGHVNSPDDTIKMVAKYKTQGRVFSLGIGEGASRLLVNGLARAGNGSALFVTLAEDLKDKVLELLGCALLPGLSDISLEWLSDMTPQKGFFSVFKKGGAAAEVGTVQTQKEVSAPNPIPHVFSSHLLVVYQSLQFGDLPVGLRISGKGPDGDVMMVVNLDSTKVVKSELVHKLMARRMVKMLEEDDKFESAAVQQRMTQLGTNYNITNKWCSNVTSAQFGSEKKKSTGPPPPPGPAASESLSSSGFSGMLFGGGGGGGKNSGSPLAKKGKGMKKSMTYSAESAPRQQCSNTRWAKSKNMSAMPSVMSAGPPMMSQMRSSRSSPPLMMRSAGAPPPGMAQQQYQSAPPAPPAPSKSAMRDDMLMGFTRLQQTDGGFSYGNAFSKDLHMSESDIAAGASKLQVDQDLLRTMIVVIYLRSVMSNRRSSWSRIGEKADGFIAAHLGATDLAELEAKVEEFMKPFIQHEESRSKNFFTVFKKK